MKNLGRRGISLLLAIVFIFSLLPTSVYAEMQPETPDIVAEQGLEVSQESSNQAAQEEPPAPPAEEPPAEPPADPVVEEPAEPVVEEPVVEEPAPEAPKPASKPAANPTSYNLGWGTYEGPMQGGKPHGMGGEIKVTKDYQIDMKNGSFKSVAKGDKVVNCKFNAGKLVQGYIHHANGQQESLYIGN